MIDQIYSLLPRSPFSMKEHLETDNLRDNPLERNDPKDFDDVKI